MQCFAGGTDVFQHRAAGRDARARGQSNVAEALWSVAEWAVGLRFDNPRATVVVLLLG